MKLTQKLMRFLAPQCEKQRQEFRHELAKVQAHTEDLMRTMRIKPEEASWNTPTPPNPK